jgi:outer membrane lipoprotein-sorting protein
MAVTTTRPLVAQVKPAAADERRLAEVLAAWERNSQSKTISAQFTRVDVSKAWNEEVRYEGRLVVNGPDHSFLEMKRQAIGKPDGKNVAEFSERLVWDGKRLCQYLGESRRLYIYHVPREQRLGPPADHEGFRAAFTQAPRRGLESIRGDRLPYMFCMRVAEAKQFYRMTVARETPEYVFIRFVPLTASGQEDPSMIGDIGLDKKAFLPVAARIHFMAGDTQTIRFTNVSLDVPVDDSLFEFKPMHGWDIIGAPSPADPPRDEAPKG